MSRRWLVPCVALLVGTLGARVAWSQSPLAERLKQLRQEWSSADDAEEPAANSRAAANSREPAASRSSGILPQIDARSLLPTNLFGRATSSNDSNDDSGQAAGSQPRAGSANLSESRATAPQTTAAGGGGSLAEGFTLPGLGRPEATASRPSHRAADASTGTNSALSRVLGAERPAPRVASRTPIEPPKKPAPQFTTPTLPPEPVRRSPSRHTVRDFDPDALRNELAGSFPAPGGADDEQTASESEPDDESPTVAVDSQNVDREMAPDVANQPVRRAEPAEAEPSPRRSPRPTPSWVNNSEPDFNSETDFSATADDTPQSVQPGPDMESTARVDRRTDPTDAEHTIRAAETNRAAAEAFGSRSSAATSVLSPGSQTLTAPVSPYNAANSTGRDADLGGQSPTRPTPTVLVSNQAPIISSDIRGPNQIVIGREVTYHIRLQNQGTVAADELVANVRIPSWAEVVDTTATRGVVRHTEESDATASLEWQLPRLDAKASQTLHLRLIPRGSRPLELGVSWTHAPVATRAVVEVQEPKIQMHIAGPDDVLFGKAYVYRLSLSNPGTGVAEDVRIDLMPLGGGGRPVGTQRIGDLAPGASKNIEVELTAREAGKLSVEAIATAAGGLKSEASRELFCRRPELEVDWRGPEMQYAGTTATYFVRVRNPGTASADDVAVRVALPTGGTFIGASEGHTHDAARGEVAWRVGSLGPGDDCYMELRCQMQTPGENRLQITAATAAGDLSDVKTAATDVVALADLTLDMSDPPGPVLVGDDALYEIRIENRGASAAEDVNVVALFSAGLEPQTVEGGSYSVADGRVTFRTIRKLPAGQHTVLRIRARASRPGTHVFRAEVLCRDLEIKLAAEETTRFYENDFGHEHNSKMPMSIGGRHGESLR